MVADAFVFDFIWQWKVLEQKKNLKGKLKMQQKPCILEQLQVNERGRETFKDSP